MTRASLSFGCILLAAIGCGAGGRNVVLQRDVPGGSGTPSVSRITDLGDLGPLPATGALPPFDSDQVFVVGELVLIEGDDFGKLPTVNIGGRPAEALARMGNGGIIARIPPDVTTGSAQVEVSHPGGRGARAIELHRFAAVVQGAAGAVHLVDLNADGQSLGTRRLDIPGATDISYSSDGAAAYVSVGGAGGGIAVLSLTAGGGPRVLRTVSLDFAPTGIAHAARAPLAVVVGDKNFAVLDTRVSQSPTVAGTGRLASPARSVAVHPQGKTAGVVLRSDNMLAVIDLSSLPSPRVSASLRLLPDETVPLARDLGFDPQGEEIWVVAGDSRESAVAGARPTRLIVVALGLEGDATVKRTVEIAGAAAPVALSVARRESIGAAAAIRSNRRRAAIVLASVNRSLVTPGAKVETAAIADIGELSRADLDGGAESLAKGQSVYSDLEISHDLRWVVAASTRMAPAGDSGAPAFGLSVVPLRGGPQKFVRLADATAKDMLSPGAVALAP